KERLKRLRANLDVLSLSATPIPRTMHMAVAGLRDMSVIQTPPEDRQPIKTYVTADDDALVKEVIERELDRGGQMYYVHNRGRSGKRAYTYFLYDPKRSMTEAADKRLDVMSGLHELGQGFRIALRDLEIRGAGNLLGVEQHGAIASVGFEMYLQMLQTAVARLRSGGEQQEVGDVLSTPEINV